MFWAEFSDSRYFQWSKYAAFDEESDFQVKTEQFQRPEAKDEEKLPKLSLTQEPGRLKNFQPPGSRPQSARKKFKTSKTVRTLQDLLKSIERARPLACAKSSYGQYYENWPIEPPGL